MKRPRKSLLIIAGLFIGALGLLAVWYPRPEKLHHTATSPDREWSVDLHRRYLLLGGVEAVVRIKNRQNQVTWSDVIGIEEYDSDFERAFSVVRCTNTEIAIGHGADMQHFFRIDKQLRASRPPKHDH